MFRLAILLGRTVGELRSTITEAELRLWMLYLAEEGPQGADRGDIHVGILASTIANVHRGKNRPPFKETDFRPRFGPARRGEEGDDDALAAALEESGATRVNEL